MQLQILPEKILLRIANYLGLQALNSLLRTSHFFFTILIDHLHAFASHDVSSTPSLCWAAKRGHEPLVHLLLLNPDTDVNIRDVNCSSNTALHHAAMHGHENIVQLLLKNGADINAPNDYRDTPLHFAISSKYHQYDRITAVLETRTPRPSISKLDLHLELGSGSEKMKALHHASDRASEAIVRILLSAGADVHAAGFKGRTPLHVAAVQDRGWDSRSPTIATLLLDYSAPLEARDSKGRTPLSLASKYCFTSMVELLLSHGADVDSVNHRGGTPLVELFSAGITEEGIIRTLLDEGANIDARDNDGLTALHHAVVLEPEVPEIVGLLLEKGADVNVRDGGDASALHKAAGLNNVQTVEMLVREGADVHAEDEEGDTALEWAVLTRSSGVVKVLLESGAGEGGDGGERKKGI
ncbi:hypothetical protein Q9L58_006210 [Maublancomyces gigas]|uniref:F-box domain-containing protein n=1 Tax=Discina gigas TaxID=1032678 RepID=A0ABR3GG04_9PEZI